MSIQNLESQLNNFKTDVWVIYNPTPEDVKIMVAGIEGILRAGDKFETSTYAVANVIAKSIGQRSPTNSRGIIVAKKSEFENNQQKYITEALNRYENMLIKTLEREEAADRMLETGTNGKKVGPFRAVEKNKEKLLKKFEFFEQMCGMPYDVFLKEKLKSGVAFEEVSPFRGVENVKEVKKAGRPKKVNQDELSSNEAGR